MLQIKWDAVTAVPNESPARMSRRRRRSKSTPGERARSRNSSPAAGPNFHARASNRAGRHLDSGGATATCVRTAGRGDLVRLPPRVACFHDAS